MVRQSYLKIITDIIIRKHNTARSDVLTSPKDIKNSSYYYLFSLLNHVWIHFWNSIVMWKQWRCRVSSSNKETICGLWEGTFYFNSHLTDNLPTKYSGVQTTEPIPAPSNFLMSTDDANSKPAEEITIADFKITKLQAFASKRWDFSLILFFPGWYIFLNTQIWFFCLFLSCYPFFIKQKFLNS